VKPVSRKAIDLRIAALDPRLVTSRRHGGKAARTAFGPVGGQYNVNAPLEVMQIEHTRVDAIVVSEVTRKPLGRPWITLAIDVASRIVMGMFMVSASLLFVHAPATHSTIAQSRATAPARHLVIYRFSKDIRFP
jgi:hypothetical protein